MNFSAFQTGAVSAEEIDNTGSRLEGIDYVTETKLNVFGCEIIQQAGEMLKMPQVVMCTAMALYHRFYYKMSYKKYNVWDTARACVLLASKAEEQLRKPRAIITVFHRLMLRRAKRTIKPLSLFSSTYHDHKSKTMNMERQILKTLGFVLYVEQPHKFILNYLKVLDLQGVKGLAQKAWSYANDSYRTMACIRHPPNVVAAATVMLATRDLGIPLPPPWWEIFDASFPEMEDVAQSILYLYTLPPAEEIVVAGKRKLEESEDEAPDATKAAKAEEAPSEAPSPARRGDVAAKKDEKRSDKRDDRSKRDRNGRDRRDDRDRRDRPKSERDVKTVPKEAAENGTDTAAQAEGKTGDEKPGSPKKDGSSDGDGGASPKKRARSGSGSGSSGAPPAKRRRSRSASASSSSASAPPVSRKQSRSPSASRSRSPRSRSRSRERDGGKDRSDRDRREPTRDSRSRNGPTSSSRRDTGDRRDDRSRRPTSDRGDRGGDRGSGRSGRDEFGRRPREESSRGGGDRDRDRRRDRR